MITKNVDWKRSLHYHKIEKTRNNKTNWHNCSMTLHSILHTYSTRGYTRREPTQYLHTDHTVCCIYLTQYNNPIGVTTYSTKTITNKYTYRFLSRKRVVRLAYSFH